MTLAAPERVSVADLQVIEVDPLTDPRWEAMVAAHPDALVFHHPNWLRVLHYQTGQAPLGLACVDDSGRFRGVLPLVRTRGVPLLRRDAEVGRRLASLPQTALAGPLALGAAARRRLLTCAVARARDEPGLRLEIKSMRDDLDQGVDGLIRVPWRWNYVLDLPARPEELRFGNTRHRNQIQRKLRHAREQGVRVREAGSLDELRQWYHLYVATMREKLVLPRPLRYFETIWRILRPAGMVRLLLAEQHAAGEARLLAGVMTLRHGRTEIGAFNGRRRAALPLCATDALVWQALHDACAAGYQRYDMGEVRDDDIGLMRFKAKWGCQRVQTSRYYSPGPGHRGRAAAVLAPLLRGGAEVWRRTPLPLTITIGERVYDYL